MIENDSDLVQMARDGDRGAFGQLVRRHYRRCLSRAIVILRDQGEAQDQVQRACFKAFAHLDQFQGAAEFASWLLRIVENECLMVLRVRRQAQFLRLDGLSNSDERGSLDLPAPAFDPEQDLIKRELAQLIRQEITHLPVLFRDVLFLRELRGLSLEQVANRLGVTVAAAKSRLLRARLELRSRMLKFIGPQGYYLPPSAVHYRPARH